MAQQSTHQAGMQLLKHLRVSGIQGKPGPRLPRGSKQKTCWGTTSTSGTFRNSNESCRPSVPAFLRQHVVTGCCCWRLNASSCCGHGSCWQTWCLLCRQMVSRPVFADAFWKCYNTLKATANPDAGMPGYFRFLTLLSKCHWGAGSRWPTGSAGAAAGPCSCA